MDYKRFFVQVLVLMIPICMNAQQQFVLKYYNNSDCDVVSWLNVTPLRSIQTDGLIKEHFFTRHYDFCLADLLFDVEFYNFRVEKKLCNLLVLVKPGATFEYHIKNYDSSNINISPVIIVIPKYEIERFIGLTLTKRCLFEEKSIVVIKKNNEFEIQK